jgi:hypothetical protein
MNDMNVPEPFCVFVFMHARNRNSLFQIATSSLTRLQDARHHLMNNTFTCILCISPRRARKGRQL